jgi:Integrase core domain.
MGELPKARVNESKPFVHTGTDYTGFINVTMGKRRGVISQKAYICIFVCLCTKAIHLELAADLSTDAFMAAFKRFLARRGAVSVMYSDGGKTFSVLEINWTRSTTCWNLKVSMILSLVSYKDVE